METEMATNHENRPVEPPSPVKGEDNDLVRRPDNVGQSGRWRHEEHGRDEANREHYGHEESSHSTEQGWPHSDKDRADK
jgi:hypothetical protein